MTAAPAGGGLGEPGDLVSIGAALWTRTCRGERIDALERLPYFRLEYLRQRKAGHSLAFTEYGHLLKLAMKPVVLPKYRRRVEAQAERDARAALANHEFVMGHMNRLFGLAA